MTKGELIALLASVPDDADVLIMGADIGIVVAAHDGSHVTLDEPSSTEEFDDDEYRVLFEQ